MKPTLQGFLIDDLKKVEHHVNEIIENIYARGQQETFAEDIEQIEMFFCQLLWDILFFHQNPKPQLDTYLLAHNANQNQNSL